MLLLNMRAAASPGATCARVCSGNGSGSGGGGSSSTCHGFDRHRRNLEAFLVRRQAGFTSAFLHLNSQRPLPPSSRCSSSSRNDRARLAGEEISAGRGSASNSFGGVKFRTGSNLALGTELSSPTVRSHAGAHLVDSGVGNSEDATEKSQGEQSAYGGLSSEELGTVEDGDASPVVTEDAAAAAEDRGEGKEEEEEEEEAIDWESLTPRERRKLRNQRRLQYVAPDAAKQRREAVEDSVMDAMMPKRRQAGEEPPHPLDGLESQGLQWWSLNAVSSMEFQVQEAIEAVFAERFPDQPVEVFIPAAPTVRSSVRTVSGVPMKRISPGSLFVRCTLTRAVLKAISEQEGLYGFNGNIVKVGKNKVVVPWPVPAMEIQNLRAVADKVSEKSGRLKAKAAGAAAAAGAATSAAPTSTAAEEKEEAAAVDVGSESEEEDKGRDAAAPPEGSKSQKLNVQTEGAPNVPAPTATAAAAAAAAAAAGLTTAAAAGPVGKEANAAAVSRSDKPVRRKAAAAAAGSRVNGDPSQQSGGASAVKARRRSSSSSSVSSGAAAASSTGSIEPPSPKSSAKMTVRRTRSSSSTTTTTSKAGAPAVTAAASVAGAGALTPARQKQRAREGARANLWSVEGEGKGMEGEAGLRQASVVRIVAGPFTGVEGTVAEVPSPNVSEQVVKVVISLMGRSAVIDVPRQHIVVDTANESNEAS